MTFSTRAGRELFNEPPTPDAVIAALAARQHGNVDVRRSCSLRVWITIAIRRRVRDGRLHRVHRGRVRGWASRVVVRRAVHGGGARMRRGLGVGAVHRRRRWWKTSRWLDRGDLRRRRSHAASPASACYRTTQLYPRDVTTCRRDSDHDCGADAVRPQRRGAHRAPVGVGDSPQRVPPPVQSQRDAARDGAREWAPQPRRTRARDREATSERLRVGNAQTRPRTRSSRRSPRTSATW